MGPIPIHVKNIRARIKTIMIILLPLLMATFALPRPIRIIKTTILIIKEIMPPRDRERKMDEIITVIAKINIRLAKR
jgi:hypothetical protein